MKYIDAEKLIERLEEMKRAEYENCGGVNSKTGALQEVQELIASLQQEQPDADLEKASRHVYESVVAHPERYGLCKPAEWSEEDEKKRRNLMSLLVNMRGDRITEETYQKYYPWLKSLRSRPKISDNWKPSEEQMAALKYALGEGGKYNKEALKSLLDDLKKL